MKKCVLFVAFIAIAFESAFAQIGIKYDFGDDYSSYDVMQSFSNIGIDYELGLTRHLALIAGLDYVFTDSFTGKNPDYSVGIGIYTENIYTDRSYIQTPVMLRYRKPIMSHGAMSVSAAIGAAYAYGLDYTMYTSSSNGSIDYNAYTGDMKAMDSRYSEEAAAYAMSVIGIAQKSDIKAIAMVSVDFQEAWSVFLKYEKGFNNLAPDGCDPYTSSRISIGVRWVPAITLRHRERDF